MIKSAPKTAVTFGGANEDPRIGYWGPMSREGKDQEAVSRCFYLHFKAW
jgi:hypothetical protein